MRRVVRRRPRRGGVRLRRGSWPGDVRPPTAIPRDCEGLRTGRASGGRGRPRALLAARATGGDGRPAGARPGPRLSGLSHPAGPSPSARDHPAPHRPGRARSAALPADRQDSPVRSAGPRRAGRARGSLPSSRYLGPRLHPTLVPGHGAAQPQRGDAWTMRRPGPGPGSRRAPGTSTSCWPTARSRRPRPPWPALPRPPSVPRPARTMPSSAQLQERHRRFEEAKRVFEQILAADPTRDEARLHLAPHPPLPRAAGRGAEGPGRPPRPEPSARGALPRASLPGPCPRGRRSSRSGGRAVRLGFRPGPRAERGGGAFPPAPDEGRIGRSARRARRRPSRGPGTDPSRSLLGVLLRSDGRGTRSCSNACAGSRLMTTTSRSAAVRAWLKVTALAWTALGLGARVLAQDRPPSAAPPAQSASPTFGAAVELVYVDAFVTRDGRSVTGLAAPNFDLRDEGVAQRVELVAVEDLPLSAFLVFDTSDSVEGPRLSALRAASEAFLAGLRSQDEIGLLSFSHELKLLQPPSRGSGGPARSRPGPACGGRDGPLGCPPRRPDSPAPRPPRARGGVQRRRGQHELPRGEAGEERGRARERGRPCGERGRAPGAGNELTFWRTRTALARARSRARGPADRGGHGRPLLDGRLSGPADRGLRRHRGRA